MIRAGSSASRTGPSTSTTPRSPNSPPGRSCSSSSKDKIHEHEAPVRDPRRFPREGRRGAADHRRRGRHRPERQVRGGRRDRPDHHLQLGPVPDGGPREPGRADALWRRQRDRHGDGPRGPAGGRAHARSWPASARPTRSGSCRSSSGRSARPASPGSRTSRPSAWSTAQFRLGLEETGMGYDREVEMIAQARAMDLLTCPYVHNEAEARAMAEAGADILVPHVGLTTKGMIGAKDRRSTWRRPRSGFRRWPTRRSRSATT